MLLVQHPGGPITVITAVTFIGVLLLGVGAAALASALGAGRLGSLIAVPVVVASGIGPIRLAAYRPEGFALGLTLLLVVLAIDWLRNKDWRSLLAAALLAATLSQVHGIAASTAAVLIGAAALAGLERGRVVEQLKHAGLAVLALLGAVVATAVVFHEASGTVHAGGLVDRGGLADPTWEFFRAARGDPPSMPQGNADMLIDSLRELYHWTWWWMAPVAILAMYTFIRRRRDPLVRRLLLFVLLAVVGMAAVASVFMFAWQGYVPRRTGASRLALEASLLVPPLLAVGLSLLVDDWRLGVRRLWSSPRRLVVAVLALVSVCGIVSLVRLADYDNPQRPSRAELATWRSLPLTSDDTVLSNGYTEGFIPVVTGAQGLLDGRAPYTFADQLRRANDLFRGAQAFFDDPAAHWGFLADNDVTWVVVGSPDSHSLGTGNVWETPPDLAGLERCAGLEQVVETTTLAAFRVTDSGPDGCGAPAG
jgi:hypothetical protein